MPAAAAAADASGGIIKIFRPLNNKALVNCSSRTLLCSLSPFAFSPNSTALSQTFQLKLCCHVTHDVYVITEANGRSSAGHLARFQPN